MAQESSSTSKLTIDVTCTPRNRANLRRLKTTSIQSFQRWEKENELLYAMIEDESAWLSSLFPDAFITPELFFYALEDGVILCLLANFIQEMAEDFGTRIGKSVPGKKVTFHKSKKGSRESKLFYSRENVDKFLTWCRWHGIPEAILFESNDAVLVDECRTGGREIVICLMEIARRSSQYEIEVPQMIKLEREIEEEELNDTYGEEEHGLALEIESRGDKSPIDSDSGVESVFEEGDPGSPRLSEFATDETEPVNQSMKKFEEEKKLRVTQKEESVSLLESSQPKTELDKKVCKIAQEYNIKIVHRLKEGKYIILGKTMFVRMLNEHLLVRIGGGWDTLEHYVMTHASKSTEGSATQPSSSNRKSSGVWSKLVDKVRRRESQPNIKESPVVISKRQRPDSSPSVYRLRDRVKKKLSVTEKDEKDISDAIRKIESSVTVKSPHSSPSFTSKTFFQLKSRFDKGRKSSRENVFDSNERKRMADQIVETITDEHPMETEPKQEETGTTMLLEFDTSQGRTEEHTTSTATVTDYSSNEFMYSQQQVAESSSANDVLLFNQQVQQSSWQSFSTNDPNDLLSLDNPPLFSGESLHPQQASEEKQAEIHNGDEEESRVEIPSSPDQEAAKSATDITAEITQEVETTPTGVSAQETAQAPSTLEIPDIEDRGLQESPEGEQADFGNVSGEADVINVSSSFESAPQDNVQQEPCYGEQYKEASDELLVSVEQTGTISDETKEEDELSSQLTIVASSEMETEETTLFQDGMMTVPSDRNAVSKEQEKPEEDEIPSQSTEEISQDVSVEKEKFSASAVVESENTLHEDKQVDEEELEGVNPPTQMTCDTAMEDNEFVALDKEKDDEVQVTEAIPSDVQADEKEEPEAAGGDGVMPLPLDADAFNKEQEKPEESEIPSQLTEELSQDVSVEQEKFPGSAVVESKNTHPEDKQVDEEEPEGDNPPTQMTFEDLRSSDTAVEDMKFVALDKEKDDEVQVTEAIQNDVQADEKEEPEAANGDDVMPVPLYADAFNKEQEKPEEDKLPSQITEELSQDASVEQEKFPASAVVESENTLHKEKQEEELKDKIVGSPTEEAERLPFAEQPTAEQQKVEQKEASHILPDTSSAAVNHKKTTKKPPVTTKKENVKAAGGSTSKTPLARKKETQKAERPKESAAKPSTRTTKPTSAKAAPKTKPLSAVPGARPTSATKRPLSAQTQKPGIDARPVTTTRTTPKTTTKLNESKRPSSTTTTKSSTVKDKQPLAPGEKQKSKSTESRSRSAALTKATDRKDGKPAASSRPLSTKTIPLPATTKTAVKKTTTTTVKSANGSTSKTEVSKTTTTAGRGGATKTKTTVRKTTESGGKPKASEGTLHPTASARNNTREKPGSRPPSATTKGKPGSNAVAKGKPTSERPKSPTKGAAKKSAPSKEKVTTSVSPPAAAEPPTISSLKQEAPDSSTPDVTGDSKESVTRVIEYTEVMEGDGDIKVLQTKVLTETVSENGHEQTVTEETVVEESG